MSGKMKSCLRYCFKAVPCLFTGEWPNLSLQDHDSVGRPFIFSNQPHIRKNAELPEVLILKQCATVYRGVVEPPAAGPRLGGPPPDHPNRQVCRRLADDRVSDSDSLH
jgi:hypothetical protein